MNWESVGGLVSQWVSACVYSLVSESTCVYVLSREWAQIAIRLSVILDKYQVPYLDDILYDVRVMRCGLFWVSADNTLFLLLL